MLYKLPIPHYFKSKIKEEIGEIYAYSAIGYFARSMMLIFEPIFMYAVLGMSVVQVMWFFTVVYGIYILIIPFGGKIAAKFGYRYTMAMSIPIMVIYWFMLLGSQSVPVLFFVAPVFLAFQKILIWPAFHFLMSRYSDGQSGKEFGVFYAILDIMYILGPVVGGFLAEKYGFQVTFIVSALVYLSSAVPLIFTKEVVRPIVYEFKETWELYKTYPKHSLGYMGFGEQAAIFVAWPIFIYIVVQSYQGTGLLTTIASFIAALLALILGKVSDKYTKRVLLKVGAFFTALVWAARFMAKGFFGTMIMDGLSKSSRETVIIPSVALVYTRASSNRIMPYVIFFEQSLAIGTFLTFLIMILAFSLTGSFMLIFIVAGLVSLLYMFI